MAHVKGSALASRVMWVELGHGAAGIQRLREASSQELRDAIDSGVVKSKWYPFDNFVEINESIDRLFGKGDLSLVRDLGRYGADANLKTIYRLFYKLGSVHWILGRAARLWGAHYDSGFCEVATRGPKAAVMRIRAFAAPHRAHCLSVMGWVERSIELSGGKQPIVEESLCRTRGDELCQIDTAWD